MQKRLHGTNSQLRDIFRAFYKRIPIRGRKNKTIRRRFKTYPLRPADAIEDQRQVGVTSKLSVYIPIDVTYS